MDDLRDSCDGETDGALAGEAEALVTLGGVGPHYQLNVSVFECVLQVLALIISLLTEHETNFINKSENVSTSPEPDFIILNLIPANLKIQEQTGGVEEVVSELLGSFSVILRLSLVQQ